jgi:hypothetical protein
VCGSTTGHGQNWYRTSLLRDSEIPHTTVNLKWSLGFGFAQIRMGGPQGTPPSWRFTATKRTRRATPMSDAHKAALAKGREEGLAVRRYLEGLEAAKPKRGRKRTSDSITKRLATIEAEIPYVSALEHLHLLQSQQDIWSGRRRERR